MSDSRAWFAWRPVWLWDYHQEPEHVDPFIKGLFNGWYRTGRIAWLRKVRRQRIFAGQKVYTEILPETTGGAER